MNPAEIDALVASVQATKGSSDSQAPSSQGTVNDYGAPPAYAELTGTDASGAEVPLGMLLDLSLPVSIELGRTSMTVQEILRLGRGAVIQLERLAGEPIDIYVGDRRFAEGEVVVLGEHFGVRISRIFAAAPVQVLT
jgi:flagellar motor switch protein FliN/FliY